LIVRRGAAPLNIPGPRSCGPERKRGHTHSGSGKSVFAPLAQAPRQLAVWVSLRSSQKAGGVELPWLFASGRHLSSRHMRPTMQGFGPPRAGAPRTWWYLTIMSGRTGQGGSARYESCREYRQKTSGVSPRRYQCCPGCASATLAIFGGGFFGRARRRRRHSPWAVPIESEIEFENRAEKRGENETTCCRRATAAEIGENNLPAGRRF